MIRRCLLAILALGAAAVAGAGGARGQSPDTTYAQKIREYTTDPRFLNELVDHLPHSATVPSPLAHFGHIIGTPEILHTTSEIYGYLRALDAASDRVLVRSIGQTEEGREMLEVIVADEATIAQLDRYRGHLNRLADPRRLADAEARSLVAEAKPIYYVTAGLHSPETGPPEMVMELAYRLAVEETPFIEAIRNNVITIIVPATEPDGRDRMVDVYRYRKAHRDVGPGLLYWGKYVAHDNNRDGYGLGLALTRNILGAYRYWTPTVMHDLHESGYFLYVSTGTGPYNSEIDALTIDEWHNLAHEEVTELTKRGMPGVWTHAFYDGWAANYLMWMANTRNSIGRFYETLGNGGADTRERDIPERATSREWYRPNPPLAKVTWSLRNNTNYMQSGVLIALKYAADNRSELVENFYLRGKRAVERGKKDQPHAWVIPRDQERPLAALDLVNLLIAQGIEVHEAQEDLAWSERPPAPDTASAERANAAKAERGNAAKAVKHEAPRGAFVVRMDQPYRNLVQILLGKQEFPRDVTGTYDDTGWTLPYLYQVRATAVNDSAILAAPMRPLTEPVPAPGRLDGRGRPYYLVNNTTDNNVTVLRFRLADVRMDAAEAGFEADGRTYRSGSFVIPAEGNPSDLADQLEAAALALGLEVQGVGRRPDVATHPVETPRVALVHTWVSTPQDAGWWRLAFDQIGIPYAHLGEQDLASADLSQFDVLIMPNTRASPQTIVAGLTEAGDPLPWRKSDQYPSLGVIAASDDVRRGMGYEGLSNLKGFVERGGVFIAEGNTVNFPVTMAVTRRVSVRETRQLQARGSVLKTMIADAKSPITYGYADSLPAYFNQAPVLAVNDNLGGSANPDWYKDELWSKEVPRTVVSFAKRGVGMSGMLRGDGEITGTPAVVDVPVGQGHVVLFAIRPFWRLETHGSHALVFNTMLHWNDLRAGWPERPKEDGQTTVADGHPWW